MQLTETDLLADYRSWVGSLTKNKNKQGRTKATRLLYMSGSSSRVEYKHFVTQKV